MFRESYEKKLSGNYLLLEEEHEAENNEFEVRMLTENKIPGLLPCSVRLIDKKKQYAYDITSRQSLERLYETQDIGFLDMQILLRGIMSGIESVSEYFLEEGNLILRPAYIYMDIETKQAALCFFPFYQMDIRQSFQEFSEYLLQKTDHADERAVVLAYGFYKQVINEDYCFEKLFQRELPVSETIPVLEAEEKRPEAASSSNAGLQEKKLPGNEKTAFFISCSVLLLLIGIVLYLEIYDPVFMEAFVSYHTIAVIFAATGAITVFLAVSFFSRYYRENHRNTEDMENRETGKKRDDRLQGSVLEKKKFYGTTKCLSEDEAETTRRLVGFGEKELKEFRLLKTPFIIGKKESVSDGILTNPSASRMHAKIYGREGNYYLTDLNSTNGTSVNGVRLNTNESVQLNYNDEVNFAGEIFYFR